MEVRMRRDIWDMIDKILDRLDKLEDWEHAHGITHEDIDKWINEHEKGETRTKSKTRNI